MKKSIVSFIVAPLAVLAVAVFLFVPVSSAEAQIQAIEVPSTCYQFNTNMTIGSMGADVVALQTWLIANGFNIPSIASGASAKGYYGAETAAAVRLYQLSIGIEATGFVGPLTRAALNACTTFPPPVVCPVGQICTPVVAGPEVSLVSTSIQVFDDYNFPSLSAQISIKVTAIGDDVYISSSSPAIDIGLYRNDVRINPGQYGSSILIANSSGNVNANGFHVIKEGESSIFTLYYSYGAPRSVVAAGMYQVKVQSINWSGSSGDKNTYYGKDDWKTNYVTLYGTGTSIDFFSRTVEASTLASRTDRAGVEGQFGPGGEPNWNWKIRIDNPATTTIQHILIVGDYGVWSTGGMYLGYPTWPIVILKDGQQINYSYTGDLGLTLGVGVHDILLYGRSASETFGGSAIKIQFSPVDYPTFNLPAYQNNTSTTTRSSITVLSPNGREIWPIGSTQTIRWSSQNMSSSENLGIKILSDDYLGVTTLRTSTPNDGEESIVVPNVVPSTKYGVIVYKLADTAVTDTNDYHFTISSSATTTQPSITVNSPKSGQTLSVGTIQTINWTVYWNGYVPEKPHNFNIYEINDNGKSVLVENITPLASGCIKGSKDQNVCNYSYSWKPTLASKTYQLIVTSPSWTTNAGYSGNFSTVSLNTPTITVLSPNGGEVYDFTTSSIPVSWSVNYSPSSVRVYLYSPTLGHVYTSGLINSTLDRQYAAIPIGATFAAGQYKVNVCDDTKSPPNLPGKSLCDLSDNYFTIASATTNRPPVINSVTAPTVLKVNETGTWSVSAYDPENGSLSYAVDWGDSCPAGYACPASAGTPSFVQTTSFGHIYSTPGTYTVKFTVRDSAGLTAQTSSTVRVDSVVTTVPVDLIADVSLGTVGDAFFRISIKGFPENKKVSYWTIETSCPAGVTLDSGHSLLCNGTQSTNKQTYYGYNIYDVTSDYIALTVGALNKTQQSVQLTFLLTAYDSNGRSMGSDRVTSSIQPYISPATPSITQSITPESITATSGETFTLTFGFPADTVSAKLYMACPAGLVMEFNGTDSCNKWITLSAVANTNVPYQFRANNTTSGELMASPYFYVYKADRPTYGIPVIGEITVNGAVASLKLKQNASIWDALKSYFGQ